MSISSRDKDVFVKEMGADDSTYLEVGCLLGQEALLNKGSRPLSDKRCIKIKTADEDDNGKRLKEIEHDKGSVTYDFDPQVPATDGRKKLEEGYVKGDLKLTVKIVLDDIGDDGTAGTYFERDILVSALDTKEDADEWTETASLEFLGSPRKTDRTTA